MLTILKDFKKFYNKSGFHKTSMNLYDNVRHDLFFEKNKKKNKIIQDLINWLNIQTGHIIYNTNIKFPTEKNDVFLLRNDKNF